ncbi:MAG TPA: cytochrome c biogenesis protein CcsA [Fibrobacteraceae bacterium]|jgi:ABC-type transport system involved in cytochrome c biogenesis permease subunit|nr:cytochrome c biogenesis protein CcsA [Fibrobacter sp.]HPW94606.1 cytochrome c biogenesis protein CcsA [Fibrobacteraceae bacterium]
MKKVVIFTLFFISLLWSEGIYDQGRIKPFDSFSRDILFSFNGKSSFQGLSAKELILKIIQDPASTNEFELFKINRAEVAELLHLDSKKRYHSYSNLKSSRFLLEQYNERKDDHPVTLELKKLYREMRSYESLAHALDYKRPLIQIDSDSLKSELGLESSKNMYSPQELLTKIRELDSASCSDSALWWRDSILFQTFIGMQESPLRIYPSSEKDGLVSAWDYLWHGKAIPSYSLPIEENSFRLRAEIYYHRLNLPQKALILLGLAIFLGLIHRVFQKPWIQFSEFILLGLAGFLLTITLGLRSYIMQAPPLGSLYEVVLLVLVFISLILGISFLKKWLTFALIPSSLLMFILLFFAQNALVQGDSFRVLPPLLNSSFWLTTHVFTIALGYSGMILSGLWAHLCMLKPSQQNLRMLYGILVFGVSFTLIGILLGGIWADLAWGRFWGWDPKECAALFVVIWAMISLHAKAGRFLTPEGFVFFSSWNIIIVALCWFGVNLLGIGLHSYGSQRGIGLSLFYFIIADALLIFFLAWIQRRRNHTPIE